MYTSKDIWHLAYYKGWFFTQHELCPCKREKNPTIITENIKKIKRYVKRISPMSHKKDKTKKKKFEFKGYVNINIPEHMSDAIGEYISDDKEIFMDMNALLIQDYSVKVYFDPEKENHRASLTCFDMDDPNGGYVIGAFADDWLTALAVVIFKHKYVAQGDWQGQPQKTRRQFG